MSLLDKCKSKAKSKAKGFMIHDVFPKVYRNYAKEPVDPKKVIFLATMPATLSVQCRFAKKPPSFSFGTLAVPSSDLDSALPT